MFARYASAITTGTFVTFALLFVMQLLITLQPSAKTDPRIRIPIQWIKLKTVETPVETRQDKIDKKKLTEVEPTPAQPRTRSGLQPLSIHTAGPTPPAAAGLLTLGAFTDGPLVSMVRVAPVYPARALTYGIEGYVVVQFDVMADGHVVNVVIIESTDSVFDSAAIKAAERFRFKPRVVDGLALESHGVQNLFRFRLDEK